MTAGMRVGGAVSGETGCVWSSVGEGAWPGASDWVATRSRMTLAPHSVQNAASSSRRAPQLLQNMDPPRSCCGELRAFSKKCGRRRNFLAKKTRPLGRPANAALRNGDVWAPGRASR